MREKDFRIIKILCFGVEMEVMLALRCNLEFDFFILAFDVLCSTVDKFTFTFHVLNNKDKRIFSETRQFLLN